MQYAKTALHKRKYLQPNFPSQNTLEICRLTLNVFPVLSCDYPQLPLQASNTVDPSHFPSLRNPVPHPCVVQHHLPDFGEFGSQ